MARRGTCSKAFLQLHSHFITRALRSTIEGEESEVWLIDKLSLPLPRSPTESSELILLFMYTGDEAFDRGAVNEL